MFHLFISRVRLAAAAVPARWQPNSRHLAAARVLHSITMASQPLDPCPRTANLDSVSQSIPASAFSPRQPVVREVQVNWPVGSPLFSMAQSLSGCSWLWHFTSILHQELWDHWVLIFCFSLLPLSLFPFLLHSASPSRLPFL